MQVASNYQCSRKRVSPLWIVSDTDEEYPASRIPRYTPAQNAPYLLSQEQLDNPLEVFGAFFQHRHLAEHRQVLWDILCAAVTSEHSELFSSRETGGWVMYFRLIEELIEAVWMVNAGTTSSSGV